ncbi:hypothetical protein OEZ86_008055 [Tetradesmus obliquus]|nr:hypothetical protein OEZ86_008055 [Tetradesmus obliquus]
MWPSWPHSSSSSSSHHLRHRRALQQLSLFPRDFVDINTQDFDPNRPIGGGLRGEFVDGFLSSLLQDSQATQQIESRLIGPSYGGPIPVASIKPVVNPSGNVLQLGANPGGLFARMGPGGAVLGSYGGGFPGPFNSRTGQYGLGGSYGMAQPYFGDAQGTAVFAVQNATYWQSRGYPTISYPCPQAVPAGTMISVGIPCGVAIVSMPAADLPTANGMPAAPQLTAPGPGGATPVGGTTPGPTPVTPVPPTTPPTTPPITPPTTPPPTPAPSPPAMPFNSWHSYNSMSLESGAEQHTAAAAAAVLPPLPDKQALTESLLAAMGN